MSEAMNLSTEQTSASMRRSPRVAVDFAVQVFASRMTCCGRGHELGRYGMAVHVPVELHVGESIRIMFQPPGSRMRFGLNGRIRNVKGFRYGLEFVEISSAELAELERVVSQLAPATLSV
jgi:hypothetical protein